MTVTKATARLKIFLTYDGTVYHGWQRQRNTPNTIQEILETKLSVIANSRVSTMSSGRTDAGVHARIQVAHATVPTAVLRLLGTGHPRAQRTPRFQGLLRCRIAGENYDSHVVRSPLGFISLARCQPFHRAAGASPDRQRVFARYGAQCCGHAGLYRKSPGRA
ncbi:MAG: hypothetical protein HY074_06980 [Deltaproteobacteria bacterium]|nr:hypothetical protein [Deltaproteobacteria bacterium]